MVGSAGSSAGAGPDVQPSGAPFAVLFVCTGNLCRSPTAQFLLAQELGAASPGPGVGLPDSRHRVALSGQVFELSSCGTRTTPGLGMDELSAAELRRRDCDPSDFRSTELTESRVAGADLVLAATRSHRSLVLEQDPLAMGRTFTVLEFAALLNLPGGLPADCRSAAEAVRSVATRRWRVSGSQIDVADPRGQPAAVHRSTADELQEAMSAIGAGVRQVLAGAGGRVVT